jgi:hypothetical protein
LSSTMHCCGLLKFWFFVLFENRLKVESQFNIRRLHLPLFMHRNFTRLGNPSEKVRTMCEEKLTFYQSCGCLHKRIKGCQIQADNLSWPPTTCQGYILQHNTELVCGKHSYLWRTRRFICVGRGPLQTLQR